MIRIITDSTCDITNAEAAALGIDIIPLTVRFGDEEFLDGVNLSHEEFYQRLEQCDELPVTSQPSPAVFEDIFRKYIEKGDEILGIFISSKLSGTFQSATIAATLISDEYSNAKIELIDSKSVAIGISLLIREAVRMRENGLFLDQLADACRDMAEHIKVYAVAGSLKYLQKGGRLSTSAAIAGSLLKITPVIELVDGKVAIACKARGQKSAASYIADCLENANMVSNSTFVYGHASAYDKLACFMERTSETTVDVNTYTSSIGCSVGTHIGPGSFGVAYLEKPAAENRKEIAC